MVDPMRRTMEVIALLVAMIFIVSMPVALTLSSLERSVFDAQLYIQAMDQENVYQQMPVLIAETLAATAQRPDGAGILSVFRNLTVQEWLNLVIQLLPPDVLRLLSVDSTTQIMAYLNGKRPDVVISLVAVKANISSPEGIDAINGLLDTQPDCTLEQLAAMALNPGSLTLCNPPDSILFLDLRPIIAAQINGLVSLVPEQVTLIPAGAPRPVYLDNLTDVRVLMRLSILLPILSLGILTVLVVRTLRSWLSWWGYPLLLAGILSLIVSLFSAPLSSLTFQLLFAPALPAFFPAEVFEMFKGLTAAIVRNALQPVLLVAGGTLLVGLVMVLIGIFLGRRSPTVPFSYRD